MIPNTVSSANISLFSALYLLTFKDPSSPLFMARVISFCHVGGSRTRGRRCKGWKRVLKVGLGGEGGLIQRSERAQYCLGALKKHNGSWWTAGHSSFVLRPPVPFISVLGVFYNRPLSNFQSTNHSKIKIHMLSKDGGHMPNPIVMKMRWICPGYMSLYHEKYLYWSVSRTRRNRMGPIKLSAEQ